MVQVQSSLFSLYDRDPRTCVPDILFAKPGDYRKVTILMMRGAATAITVQLAVVEESTAYK